MRGKRAILVLAGAGTLAAAGCGGQRQDADEPSGTFPVAVTHASFPASQHLAEGARMRISVRNAGRRTIPVVAVTISDPNLGTKVQAFAGQSSQANVASRSRPIWIVDHGPYGGDTAYDGTWALGPLRPHHARTFTWSVTATRAGRYTLQYLVSAGLTGKGRARLAGGGVPRGRFHITVSGKPAQARVAADGSVVTTR